MPLKRYHFDQTKSKFRDEIALRDGWDLVKMPSLCACNENFTVAHAFPCPKGRYMHIRHNELRNSFANLLSDVCHDVEIELHLQALQGKTFALKSTTTADDSRSDIKTNGLWESRFNKNYFDVKKNFQPPGKNLPRKQLQSLIVQSIYSERTNISKKQLRLRKQHFVPLSSRALVELVPQLQKR